MSTGKSDPSCTTLGHISPHSSECKQHSHRAVDELGVFICSAKPEVRDAGRATAGIILLTVS